MRGGRRGYFIPTGARASRTLKNWTRPSPAVPAGTERIVQGWLRELDQQKLDDWISGKVSVKELVSRLLEQYRLLARSSKWAILRWLDGLSGKGIYDWLHEQRPDLRLGEEAPTVARIEDDLKSVRELVEAL
jgi:hypothetical protein